MHLSFCLTGENSLLVQCAQAILARNYAINLIISPLASTREWAKKQGIPCLPHPDCLKKENGAPDFEVDFLLSIVNSHFLSRDMRQCARLGVINYHDSLLPDYAGLNATTWAIINNESEHGVTWHFVNDHIDEGDILCQQRFAISDNETSLSLNNRCYEAAISSFQTLLDRIGHNALEPVKQNLHQKRYFGAGHPLPGYGFVNWHEDQAATIERWCRALTFGQYYNPVGTLKWVIDGTYYILTQVSIYPDHSASSGTVIACDTSELVIKTPTDALAIHQLALHNGKPISIEEVIRRHQLSSGQVLASPAPYLKKLSPEVYSQYLKQESRWLNLLQQYEDHLTFSRKNLQAGLSWQAFGEVSLPENSDNTRLLLTALLIYLVRLNDHERLHVHIYRPETAICPLFLSPLTPVTVQFNVNDRFQDCLRQTDLVMDKLKNSAGYLTDLQARHPEPDKVGAEPGIIISFPPLTNQALPDSAVLHIHIDTQKQKVTAFHRMNVSSQGGNLIALLANFSAHVSKIAEALLINPSECMSRFNFLTPEEMHHLCHIFGPGETRPLPTANLVELFDRQVAINPGAIAITSTDHQVSYQQLWRKAESVAASLEAQKIPPKTMIGIYLNRSTEMLAVVLGILKAGCIYVPLDTRQPLPRTEYPLQVADICWVITETCFLKKLNDYFADKNKLQFLTASSLVSYNGKRSLATQSHHCGRDNLAYLLFTSGTTSSPRGVMITHKNVINYCLWFIETTQVHANSIVDFSSSLAFDLSVPCTIAPLLAGASIAICSETTKSNPLLYLNHLQEHKVTHVEATPGYLSLMLDYPDTVKQLQHVECLLLGADVVLTSDVNRWRALCPNHKIINEYGPTETTVSVTSFQVTKQTSLTESSVPIGRPAYNNTCYLLDKYGNLCPTGMRGVLHVHGAQVAMGYLNNESMTREKFFVADFGDGPNLIYQTGDVAYWLPDGNLQFCGRNDQQIKRHGYRIELTEIESVLMTLPTVRQAVVVLHQDQTNHPVPKAWLVVDEDKNLSDSNIRKHLAQQLPTYMIPDEFYLIDAIPLKENEKIDVQALKEMPGKLLLPDKMQPVPVSGSIEDQVQSIWQMIFHHPIHDQELDFFDAGGDSIMALELTAELNKHFGLNLSLQTLFEYPGIAKLTKKIRSMKHPEEQASLLKKQGGSLILLSKGRCQTPLFLVHPIGGTVFCYKQLASFLQGKYTVYGVQDPNMNGATSRFNRLEDMASQYLEDIRDIYKGDTLFLAGASFGATVAFEMARQAGLSDLKIAFLGLIDGWTRYPEDILSKSISRSLRLQLSLTSEINARLTELELYRRELLINYKIPMLEHPATLYKAIKLWPEFKSMNAHDNGWSAFMAQKLTTVYVPGDHGTMLFDANAIQLAKAIQLSLDDALEPVTSFR